MKQTKRKRLERKGWRVGDARDFLDLTDEESAYIALKLALSERLKATRENQGLTQIELAELMSSSQSRVAKMEAGDPSVSMDLLVKGLLALGATPKDIAKAMTGVRAA